MEEIAVRKVLFMVANPQQATSRAINCCCNFTSKRKYKKIQSGSFDLKIHLIDYLIHS